MAQALYARFSCAFSLLSHAGVSCFFVLRRRGGTALRVLWASLRAWRLAPSFLTASPLSLRRLSLHWLALLFCCASPLLSLYLTVIPHLPAPLHPPHPHYLPPPTPPLPPTYPLAPHTYPYLPPCWRENAGGRLTSARYTFLPSAFHPLCGQGAWKEHAQARKPL